MYPKLKSALLTLTFAGSALFCATAYADTFSIVLTPPAQTAAPGSTVVYSGTVSAPLTNSGADYINAGEITFSGPQDIVFDTSDSLTFNGGNAIAPGSSVSGDLFSVFVPSTEASGNFIGSFTLLGGPDFITYSQLGQVNFTLNVASAASVTPEPSSYLLLASGLLGVYALVRRQRAFSA